MPAQQPSAKLLGVRRGAAPFSKAAQVGPLVIDPNRLGQVTLNRDAIQALTLAQAEVQLRISPGGTTAVLVSMGDQKPIGGIDDLAKLMSLRSFVTKEKKQSASSEVREQMFAAAYRLSHLESGKTEGYKQKPLDNSFVVAAKPYQAMCVNVRAHIKNVEENFNTSDEYKEVLIRFAKMTERVLVDVLSAMVRGEKEKGLLDQISFERGLPAYIRNKLTMKTLSLQKDMDLSRVLFPSDPSKGLGLTVKEWRSAEFVAKLGFLVSHSAAIATIIREDDLFLELIGMTAEQFANAEDPRVQRVLKTRILVVPPFEDHSRVLSLLEKQNFRGFGLPATAMDQSKDRLANLCAVFIRAYAFSVRMAETIPDFYDRIFPVGTIKAPDEKLGNYAKQCLTAISNGVKCDLLDIIKGDAKSKALMAWITRECKLIPDGDLYKKIASAIGADKDDTDQLSLFEVPKKEALPPKAEVPVDVVSKVTSRNEALAIENFVKSSFAIAQKDNKKKKAGTASSVLLRETRNFLKHVRKEHSASLADAMEGYFRGFYAEGIQLAAVRIAEARFDEFDEEGFVGSSSDDDSSGDEED
jgi:hypothetical protein